MRLTSLPGFSMVLTLGLTWVGWSAASRADTWPPPAPAQLLLSVGETAGVARSGEIVRSGVPIPRSRNVLSTASLAVVDAIGTPVPAEFRILARWDAGLAVTTAPIQWLLVGFPASVAANGSTSYRLVTDGSVANPAPGTPLSLSQVGNQVTVATGAATFVLGGGSSALFDDVRLGVTSVAGGGSLSARTGGVDYGQTTTRRVFVESQGPLSAVVVVEGTYSMPAVGSGLLSSRRRYVFTAGSPTAIVRHSVAWEGALCPAGEIVCDAGATINGVRLQAVRDALTLSLPGSRTVSAVGAFGASAVSGGVVAGDVASVRQTLRSSRTAPLAFQVSVPGTGGASGTKADGGMLAVSTASGAVAIGLGQMHRYEPQALRLLSSGSLAVDVVDGDTWLSARQALFTTLGVAALPASPSRADLDRSLWAPLNRPLRAWPSALWFGASEAVDELPVGALPASLATYDTLVPAVLAKTLTDVDAKGLPGLMTFGLYPRFWGNPILSDELDCAGNDPTPTESFDDLFWCATWTDYHSTVATAPIWAMRSGAVQWLDEIGVPGALRMLHTQIYQCDPADTYFYCGQAPAGYGGYRADFNSSHAYWQNLLLYYWLSGDGTVVETVQRGAGTMRGYLCPAPPCLPDTPPTDFWAQLTGRVASQWFDAFRFVGLASNDATYLDDYKSGLARAVTQNHAEVSQSGSSYGFYTYGGDPVTGAGTYSTDQLWMTALYDMNNIYRLKRDTADTPIGNPLLAPSQVLRTVSRTLSTFGPTVAGDGTAAGIWPNVMSFGFTGSRIGGTLTSIASNPPVPDCGLDECLYDTTKSTLTAALVRAGQDLGETAVTQMGRALTERALSVGWNGGNVLPLGKESGEYLVRTHSAVARLAWADLAADLIFRDGFQAP